MNIRFHSLVAALGVASLSPMTRGEPKLAPTLDTKLDGTNSVVHCPTLQIAWDGLKQIVSGPVQMQKQNDLLRSLNEANCPTNVVPEDAHVAMAGFADQGIVPKIEDALRRTFGADAPRLPAILSDQRTAIVTYAHLSRTLPFPRKFARATTIPLQFRSGLGSHPVAFFGAPPQTAADFASQVKILHYSGEDDFVVMLSSQLKDEFVVLAKIQPPDTLSAGVATVRRHLEAERKGFTELVVNGKKEFYLNTLWKGDSMAIPLIDLNIATNFLQLCNTKFTNPGFENVWLHQVHQDIAFRMDETGATVRSTAYGAAFGGEPSKPRRFHFDRPFLLTLWKNNAPQPYLSVWIASADVLIPFRKEAGATQQPGGVRSPPTARPTQSAP